ncbi:hypothetical protein AAVH_07284 [Aphelenchoides avenae]|nr:hypothetical protein AAVH_07284 [Aphelenchus avenae]
MIHNKHRFVVATALSAISFWLVTEATARSTQSEAFGGQFTNRQECNDFYTSEIARICTAPDEEWPCLPGSKLVNGEIDHLFKLPKLGSSCCAMECSEEDIREYYCCTTDECMRKCYTSENKPKRDSAKAAGHPRLRLGDNLIRAINDPFDA